MSEMWAHGRRWDARLGDGGNSGDRGEQLSVHIPVIRYRLKTGLVRSTL